MVLRDGTGPKVVPTVTSCGSCLAWGPTYSQAVCVACYSFAGRYRTHGACRACGRQQPLKRGHCRLCWCQAALERPTRPGTPLAPYLTKVRHQQLFLAGMSRRRAAPRAFPPRHGVKGRPHKPPPRAVVQPRVAWSQPPLFNEPRPCYRYGRVDLRRRPAPENPWLAWALHLAHVMAETRGFDPSVRRALNRNLVMLLADHTDGALICTSDFHQVLRDRGASIAHTIEVLQAMGILGADRPASLEQWLAGKLDGLAPGIRAETQRWARTLRGGGPRTRARNETTVQGYLRAVRPALLAWSARYDHLREVTHADVVAHAELLRGRQRHTAMVALRSLFAWAKANGVVFANPTRNVSTGRRAYPVFQPLTAEELASTLAVATTPQARLVVALAAVHAARCGAIRALHLDDVDLANRRLRIAGRPRPLDELTQRLLVEWLDHRRRRWPNTANPHLLLSTRTALGHGPVSAPWANRILRGLPATLERLRIDRQLEEALTHRADPLHLAAVFDLDESTAIRYAASARQLMNRPHEAAPVASPRTEASTGDDKLLTPLGSR
jgi:hypothetical protein